VITGEQLLKDIMTLIKRIKRHAARRGAPWRTIVGVARGGVFPAQRVAEALGVEYREIRVSYYDGMTRKERPQVVQGIADERGGDGILVIDDVADTGGTASCVRQMLPKCSLATVYTKPPGWLALLAQPGEPAIYGRKMNGNWIVFPWDQSDWHIESPKLVAAFRENCRISGD